MSSQQTYFLQPQSGGERIDLVGEVLVGRKEDCDLVLTEGHPSRHHARFTITSDSAVLTDLGSANGTFVNGEKVDADRVLAHGDEVAFDSVKFRFVCEGEDEPEATDATVIRSVEELERTVIRPAAELKESLEQSAPAAAAESAAGKPVQPGSWADPESKGGAGTVLYSREELAQMAGSYNTSNPESDDPYLEIGTGPQAGSVVLLNTSEGATEWAVGSDASRDIHLEGDGVSGFHAKILHEAGRWKIVDQMSANGSYVNDSKVITAFLNPGDRIKLGTVEFVIAFPTAKTAKKPAQSGGSNKTMIVGIAVFVGLLAVLAGAYVFLA